MPDLYAFCQYLFLGQQEPEGLIPDGFYEGCVYCRYYADQNIDRVDIMRSPHLNNEHTIRRLLHSEKCKEWFKDCGQNIIYSIHDYLMLAVQGDVDGDILLISPEASLIDMEKPHHVLYYRMFKAEPQQISNKTIYDTLCKSFSCNDVGKSIGYISNAISKIWNADKITDKDLDMIKYLTMLSNFTIDYPKTQANIKLPEDIQNRYNQILNEKLPFFFKWAKGKKKVNRSNDSVVNQINRYIAKGTNGLRYKFDNGQFDYSILQRRDKDGNIKIDRTSKAYQKIRRLCYQLGNQIRHLGKDLNADIKSNDDKFDLLYSMCYQELLKVRIDKIKITNYIIDLAYCQPEKIPNIYNTLWKCFGNIIVENIKINLSEKDYRPKTKTRMAYKRQDIKTVKKIKSKVDKRIEEIQPIIYQSDIETIRRIKNDKDKKIYYVLLCLCKIFVDHQVSISNGRKSKLNNSKILKMAGLSASTTIKASFKRLEKMGLIEIKENDNRKVISLADYNYKKFGDVAFKVLNAWNPIIYFEAYFNNRTIAQCAVCGKDYVKIRNNKTCSYKCAEILKRDTKVLIYQRKKETV